MSKKTFLVKGNFHLIFPAVSQHTQEIERMYLACSSNFCPGNVNRREMLTGKKVSRTFYVTSGLDLTATI